MAEEHKKTQIKQTTFSRVGNLAFYDGWSPTYIYFKSLYNASNYYIVNNGPGSWDPSQAQPIAQQAISDALGHQYIKNNSKEDSDKHFEEQFTQKIIPFLEKAYLYEKQNERFWIESKYQELKKMFQDDAEKLQPIQELMNMIRNIDKGFNYKHYMTLINFILSGVEDTKKIVTYEEERLKEMQETITRLIRSRMNQTEGVLRHSTKSSEEKVLSRIQSARKLKDTLQAEYINTGTLAKTEIITNEDGTTKTKYTFGGKQFSKIKPTVDNVIKLWSETVIKDIMQKPVVLSQIMTNISKNIPKIITDKANTLEPQIKQIIILAILEYGSQHLADLLNKQLNDAMITEVEKDLITNTQLFDTAHELQVNIKGIPEDEIQTMVKEADLLKNVKSLSDLYQNTAKGLFNTVDQAIALMDKSQEEQSTLYKVLNNPSYTSGRNYDQTKQIIELIHAVEKIQTELDKIVEQYHKKNIDIIKEVHLPQNKSVGITISIINGVPQVQENELLQAIKGTEAFSYMNFQSFSAEPLKAMINKLKSKASTLLRSDIIKSISAGLGDIGSDELTQSLRQELQKINVTVEGYNIMDILASMQFKTAGERLVGISPKNGVISISFSYENLMNTLRTKIMNSEALTKKYAVVERHYTMAQNNFYTTMYKEINSDIKRISRHNTKDTRSKLMYSILQNTDKNTKQVQNAMERLEKWGTKYTVAANNILHLKGEQAAEKKRQFMEDLLNNSIYISTVVTNSDNYMNNVGFLGNSLGDSLDAQLTKISSIFRYAGAPISKEELNWIKFAVLNCFEGSILGTSNKNIIESYLGSLIAFALFNEGGVEASIIANTFEKYYKTGKIASNQPYHSARMLTLYKTDSIYVPGSVILKRTLDTLKKDILPAIQTQIPNLIRRGAGVTIINNINESIIPNRPIKDHLKSQDTHPWNTASTAAMGQVKIQVLFLAGLLDIIRDINKTIGQLEMPQ